MRKRVYSQLCGRVIQGDTLVGDIHAYHNASSQTPAMAAECTPVSHIHNMVGTCMIEKSVAILDLRTISRVLPNCVYDQQTFAAITVRIFRPFCTVLLFTSGKMVLTGCCSLIQCVLAAHEVVRLLHRSARGQVFRVRNVTIQNIVGNVDIGLREQ